MTTELCLKSSSRRCSYNQQVLHNFDEWIKFCNWIVKFMDDFVVLKAQCGWTQHDYGHWSVVKNRNLSHVLQQFFIGVMKVICLNLIAIMPPILHAFHETCHSVRFIVLVHSHQGWKEWRTAFAFIFGVNWLWHCGVTASFGVFCHDIKM